MRALPPKIRTKSKPQNLRTWRTVPRYTHSILRLVDHRIYTKQTRWWRTMNTGLMEVKFTAGKFADGNA